MDSDSELEFQMPGVLRAYKSETGAAAKPAPSSPLHRPPLMKKAKVLPSSWEELAPDLLGLVLRRLPSLGDRVRLRAVCRPWRAGAQPQRDALPPPLPWLALRDGGMVDLDGASVRCPPILREGVDFGFLAFENLAFIVHHDGSCSLKNPLSGLMLPLPNLAPAVLRALDKSPEPPKRISDIAFSHGKLYALSYHEGLHVAELVAGQLSMTELSSGFNQCIANDPKQWQIYHYGSSAGPAYLVLRYLAECGGRLLLMKRWISFPQNARLGDHDRTVKFEVFEADLASIPGRWTKVDRLYGHAIFLGSECSKSVLASQCAGGVQEDCIYFMHRIIDNPSKEYFNACVDPLADSGVYNLRDGKFMPLLPDHVMAELRGKQQFLTWFFPTDA
ncbi:hypothetical protein EJB05_49669, partial [Eragrostis curvula]